MSPGVPLPANLPLWLIAGAVAGVLARSLFVSGQNPWSRETGQDTFLAVVFAVAWGVPIPGLSLLWPPFEFPASVAGWQSAVLFAGLTFLFADLGKRFVMARAPALFAKYTGQAPEPTGKGETKP